MEEDFNCEACGESTSHARSSVSAILMCKLFGVDTVIDRLCPEHKNLALEALAYVNARHREDKKAKQ